MTREETKKLLMCVAATYPNFKVEDKSITLNMWQYMLDGQNYNDIMTAFKAYVLSDTSGFAPSPGALVNKLHLVEDSTQITPEQAWQLVTRAIRNGNYGSEKEFDKLPPEVQRVVVSPGAIKEWARLDSETVHTVIASNFKKEYRASMERERELRKMPPELLRLTNQTVKMIGGKQ